MGALLTPLACDQCSCTLLLFSSCSVSALVECDLRLSICCLERECTEWACDYSQQKGNKDVECGFRKMWKWLSSSTIWVMLKAWEENDEWPLDTTDDPGGTCKEVMRLMAQQTCFIISYTPVKQNISHCLFEVDAEESKECKEFRIHKRREIRPAYPWS